MQAERLEDPIEQIRVKVALGHITILLSFPCQSAGEGGVLVY
ncbi:hypothetical protein KKC1_09840 [Calderihabitans maritimus]|uniref:Uncharacterized protein n=1 Tax=Calderihabitans maritimus TaxID=1246530 RepID=A0A1Z5HQN7_9FIRM|nr:hypothetical protein KKC1_09840 [Calderihabitans maritimus]